MAESHERDKVRRPCVAYLRLTINSLRKYDYIYWTSPPDFGKQKPHVARKLKLDGYSKGNFDMTIIAHSPGIVKVWLIEFKYGRNGYTTEQQLVADSCKDTPVEAVKIYSVEEFQAFLKENLK